MAIRLVNAPCGSDGRGESRVIVAVLVTHRGRLCLLRRSGLVGSDRGRWHCVTGYLEPGVTPKRQALRELAEETGLWPEDLAAFEPGPVLNLPDGRSGSWRVLVYRAETVHGRLALNWEHDDACWVSWPATGSRELVAWLPDVVDASRITAAA